MLKKIMSILICCISTSIFAENWLGSDNSKVDVDTLEHFKETNSFALTIHTSVGENLYMKAKLYIYCDSNEYQFKSIRAYKNNQLARVENEWSKKNISESSRGSTIYSVYEVVCKK